MLNDALMSMGGCWGVFFAEDSELARNTKLNAMGGVGGGGEASVAAAGGDTSLDEMD